MASMTVSSGPRRGQLLQGTAGSRIIEWDDGLVEEVRARSATRSRITHAGKAVSQTAWQAAMQYNMFPQVVRVEDATIVEKGRVKTRVYLPVYTCAVLALLVYYIFTPITVKMDSSVYPPLTEYQGFAAQAPVCPCEGNPRIQDAAQVNSPVDANFSSNACSMITNLMGACVDGTHSSCFQSNASILLAYGIILPMSVLCNNMVRYECGNSCAAMLMHDSY